MSELLYFGDECLTNNYERAFSFLPADVFLLLILLADVFLFPFFFFFFSCLQMSFEQAEDFVFRVSFSELG